MKNMIDLQVRDGLIVAIHTGPHAEHIVELFGTPIVPTPFLEAYGLDRAAAEIRALNPDCVVYPAAIPAPMLGQDAAEAQRLAFGGRRIDLLKESREFDSSRLEANGLFPPKQRGMFGE